MNNCIVCKGDLENRKTNFVADLGNCIIIVKDVPSQVCSQCGEVSYSHEVAMQLENREPYERFFNRSGYRPL